MTLSKIVFSTMLFAGLSACGEGTVDQTEPTAPRIEAKAPKFKGAKLAPPQEVMNREAALAFWRGEGPRIVTPGEACKRAYRGSPIPPACQTELDDVVAKSTFTPRECVKGDQRNRKNYSPVNPVTCYGIIDTPRATADATILFHETDEGIKAYSGGTVGGSLVKR